MSQMDLFAENAKIAFANAGASLDNLSNLLNSPRFNGSDYDPKFDNSRLTGQIKRVYELMIDGQWRTLAEIESATHDPQASISAQMRNLKKDRFGGFTLNKRSKGERSVGLWEYQLLKPNEL